MLNLYEMLKEYRDKGIYPMHMPGHKRNPEFEMEMPYQLDVTEVEGMDDLQHPKEALKEAMERAAKVYGAEKSFYLVNGSTGGILSAVSACCGQEDTVIMARNCHKSVYNAAFLRNLKPEYIYPVMSDITGVAGKITMLEVEEALERAPDAKCVVITSPTYEGIVSNIREIAAFLHEKGIPLIVDEAHGAHLKFHDSFPESAVDAGADIVIHSIHKTLPAFTQSALLHYQSNLVPEKELIRYLNIYQTSSPSYLLMASIDRVMCRLLEEENKDFEKYVHRLDTFYDKMKRMKNLYLLDKPDKERSKLVIVTKRSDMSGLELAKCLREDYQIETEMSLPEYVVAMTSVADTQEGFERLKEALLEIDSRLESTQRGDSEEFRELFEHRAEQRIRPYDAVQKSGEEALLAESVGAVSKEYIYVYPPGIPLVVPGERLVTPVIRGLEKLQKQGFELQGLSDSEGMWIKVV